MKYGIESAKLIPQLPYAAIVQGIADTKGVSAALMYAIAWRETIRGQINGKWDAEKVVSADGGHGLFQLTSSYPSDWNLARANAAYAVDHFITPATEFFAGKGLTGEALVRCVAAAFNAGTETAWEAHLAGNVDGCTTGHNYAQDVFSVYNAIVDGKHFG